MGTATLQFKTFAGLYRDSVTLMQIAAQLREREGIDQTSCVMATPANLQQLADAGMAVDLRAAPSDLLVVVQGAADACERALLDVQAMLEGGGVKADGHAAEAAAVPASLAQGLREQPDADLALISVPGDYAAAEAMKALRLGLHVLLFSDNVPLAEEVAIKRLARERGLLVMGPDCGTAVINGVPLGFANHLRRGAIGLVAASGTGLQEVMCRIHNRGGGVSQAIGTGGRDLHEAVGGITMLQGLHALADDDATRVIVLVSKPPPQSVAAALLDAAAAVAARTSKAIVAHFLGAPRTASAHRGVHLAHSLRHAADVALALSLGEPALPTEAATLDADAQLRDPPAELAALAAPPRRLPRLARGQRWVRALFTGGTFCYEAQLALLAEGLACRSNAPAPGAGAFSGAPGAATDGHVLLDLGDDDFTRGRPHPMIDPQLRNDALRAQARDPGVAVILFDVVLGTGAHANPAEDLAAALRDARGTAQAAGRSLALVGHVCGTDGDPQDRAAQVATLRDAGAVISDSNLEAARLAAWVALLAAST